MDIIFELIPILGIIAGLAVVGLMTKGDIDHGR